MDLGARRPASRRGRRRAGRAHVLPAGPRGATARVTILVEEGAGRAPREPRSWRSCATVGTRDRREVRRATSSGWSRHSRPLWRAGRPVDRVRGGARPDAARDRGLIEQDEPRRRQASEPEGDRGARRRGRGAPSPSASASGRPASRCCRARAARRRGRGARHGRVPLLRQPDQSTGAHVSRDERPPGERGAGDPRASRRAASRRIGGPRTPTPQRDRDDARRRLALLERGHARDPRPAPRASNFTFLARVRDDQDQMLAVYKPAVGRGAAHGTSRRTLAAREVAAYVVADGLGWPWSPDRHRARARRDRVRCSGSWPSTRASTTSRCGATARTEFRRIALFDDRRQFNADRESGHCLLAEDGRVLANRRPRRDLPRPQAKLRTVIWDFVDEPIPEHAARGPARRSRSRDHNQRRAVPRAPPDPAHARRDRRHRSARRRPPALGQVPTNPVPGARTWRAGRVCGSGRFASREVRAPRPLFAGMTLPPFQRLLDDPPHRRLPVPGGRRRPAGHAGELLPGDDSCRRCGRTRACATRATLRGWLFTMRDPQDVGSLAGRATTTDRRRAAARTGPRPNRPTATRSSGRRSARFPRCSGPR